MKYYYLKNKEGLFIMENSKNTPRLYKTEKNAKKECGVFNSYVDNYNEYRNEKSYYEVFEIEF